uniref:ATP synthase subunit a n=1 Tax=Arion vulgaris TaxID=1028688 RepID=A0A6C0AAY1_9EUPU|nr:ATP synthase F0 subunit 6 [Arion vulgaris]QHS71055.1 ATP synthase F0 subunit 6 [Arion vulgaris]
MFSDLFSSLDGNFNFKIWAIPVLVTMIFFYPKGFLFSVEGSFMNKLSSLWVDVSSFNLTQSLLTKALFFVLMMNLLGLFPYVYGVTTNIWLNMSLALLMWGGVLLSGFSYNLMSALAHLVPSGSPVILIPFLVLIETISILIRPLTLTVRLVANISAGHIVMTLLSNVLSPLNFDYSFFLTFSLSVGYTLFEIFVSLIQAYIFTLLLSLYIKEHPST